MEQMKYIIHACNKRLWYVKEYMIPDMLKQGIAAADIEIYLDKEGIGNLEACMSCFSKLPDNGNTWHLQDDVLISSRFKEVTEKYAECKTIVNGICTLFDEANNDSIGEVVLDKSWYSFPCIMIPNKLAKECSSWFYHKSQGDHKYIRWAECHKGDDYIFKEFLYKNYPDIKVINLVPNIIDHVDCLLGGSVTNDNRCKDMNVRSKYWEEEELFMELEQRLGERNGRTDNLI